MPGVEPPVDEADVRLGRELEVGVARRPPGVTVTPSGFSVISTWPSGSVVRTVMVRSAPVGLAAKPVIRLTVSTRWATASAGIVAAGSSVTATSQLCMACSLSRRPTNPASPISVAPMVARKRACSSGVSEASRSSIAWSAASTPAARSSGVFAFHSSQIGWGSWGSPPRLASMRPRVMTAPEPRWERTSATFHSVG